MITFILRWQLYMLKRQYRYFQNWFPLIVFAFIQSMYIFVAFFEGTTDFDKNLGMAVLYVLVFSTPQAIIGYQTLKLTTTLGILGISPLPPSAKSAWVLLMLSINSVIITFFISLFLGIMMAVRVSALGGLIVFPVTFIFFFGFPFGISALFELIVKAMKPKNPQKVLIVISALVMGIGFVSLSTVLQDNPIWLNLIGRYVLDLGRLDTRALPVIYTAVIVGIGGYALRVYLTIRTREHLGPMSVKLGNKTYISKTAPQGLIRLFYWVNAIFYKRRSFEFLGYLVMLFLFTIIQHQMWIFGIVIIGGILGSTLFMVGPKGLPILFLAPLSLRRIWYSQVVTTLPLFLFFWMIAILLATWSNGHLSIGEIVTSFIVAYTNLISNSLVQLIYRQMYLQSSTTEQQKKRRTVSATIMVILTSVILPSGFTIFSYHFAMYASLLAFIILVATFLIGHYLLERSKRLRYFWHL